MLRSAETEASGPGGRISTPAISCFQGRRFRQTKLHPEKLAPMTRIALAGTAVTRQPLH